jgi:hypothetical protein
LKKNLNPELRLGVQVLAMNEMKLHVHQSFKERFFWVGLMVLFAISFHSLA